MKKGFCVVVKLAYVNGYLKAIHAVADKFRNDAMIMDLYLSSSC